jgi:hypothetical protein
MTRLGRHEIGALMVRSPVAPIAFYTLLDAFRILVAHERRHMAQAERVVRSVGFPQVSRSAGS